MLVALMGRGARSVFARNDEAGAVATVSYGNNKRGLIELNNGFYRYGGHLITPKNSFQFNSEGEFHYKNLMEQILDFLHNGTIPVELEETLEVLAILEAMENSIASGKEEVICL